MAEFKKGDVVVLKSGGPDMTVVDVGDYSPLHSETAAKCMWFDKAKGAKHEDVFDVETLKPAPKPFIGVA